jgi:hypothetical protein
VGDAYRKVGVSIMTAAITTCGAVTMLWFCTIQIFVKVGLIIAASTLLGIITALAPAGALLACCGPRSMKRTCKGQIVVIVVVVVMCGGSVLSLYIAHLAGRDVMGPSGEPLFDS